MHDSPNINPQSKLSQPRNSYDVSFLTVFVAANRQLAKNKQCLQSMRDLPIYLQKYKITMRDKLSFEKVRLSPE